MDRNFKRKRSRDRKEWAAILGALLLILCQLYRVSGEKLWIEDILPAGEWQVKSTDASQMQTQMQTQTQNQEMISEEEEPSFSLYAKGAVLMDGYTGRVLYGKNVSEAMPMASTTKIMTCILALEYGNPDDLVEVSSYAASMPDVQLGMNKGEYYRLGDLLFSLMLESHNDSAVAIAEYIAAKQYGNVQKDNGSQEPGQESETKENTRKTGAESIEQIAEAAGKAAAERTAEESKALVAFFAGLMNQKAKEIGCENTFFITPNGLDASVILEDETGNQVERVHSTTAGELALIMRYCLSESEKSEDFVEITRTREISITDETGNRSFSCTNHNRYLDMKEGAVSGKTGFTGNAGYCYVGAVNQDGVYLIVALLACGWPPSKSLKWQDMNTLVNYGLEQYSCVQVEKTEEESADYVIHSYNEKGKSLGIEKLQTEIVFEPFTLLMKEGEVLSQNWYLDLREAVPGETMGAYEFTIGEKICKTFPIRVKQKAAVD